MKKFLIAFILSVFIIQTAPPAFCITSDSFNLAGVIESIINYQNKADFIQDVEESAKENYLYAAKNFLNGNVTVAYSEYSKTIDKIDSNISLLMFSKKLYEYGIFSLADKALSKISKKDKMKTQIEDLKKAYKPSYELSKEEEIYLTKIYASIFYNNSPEEAAFDLIKKTTLLENSDYANYIMALSMFECKQYNQAVNYVNKAIEKNAINSNYKYFKARALLMAKN